MTNAEKCQAICDKWAKKLGIGFHPDTHGDDYEPALSPQDGVEYEDDMDQLFELAEDPYHYGVIALKKLEGGKI